MDNSEQSKAVQFVHYRDGEGRYSRIFQSVDGPHRRGGDIHVNPAYLSAGPFDGIDGIYRFEDVADAAERMRGQQEAMKRSGYGGYGGGYGAPAAGGGYFGPQLAPAAAGAGGQYGYQIGPFYVNSADEMRAIFDRQYRVIKQQEDQAGRLRAGGRY